MRVLEVFLYILAGIILVAGLWIGISLMSSPAFSGAGAILGNFILMSMLHNLISSLGTAVIVMGVIMAAVLFAIGRVIHTQLRLEQRIERLEIAGQPG